MSERSAAESGGRGAGREVQTTIARCGKWGLLGNSSRNSHHSFAGLFTFFEPVTLAVHFQDMDMMSQPIEQRSGKTFGAEYLGPFVEGKIAGDQRGAPLVTLAKDLKQEFGAGA